LRGCFPADSRSRNVGNLMSATIAARRVGCILVLVCAGTWGLALPTGTSDISADPLALARDLELQGHAGLKDARQLRLLGRKGDADKLRKESTQKIDKARIIYREVLRSNPGNIAARRLLVESYAGTGDPLDSKEAITELVRAVEADHDRSETWLLVGNITAGLIFKREVSELNREDADTLLKRFFARARLSDDDQQASPVKRVRELLVSEPDSPETKSELVKVAGMFYTRALEMAGREGKSPAEIATIVADFYLRLNADKAFDFDKDRARLACEAARTAAEAQPYNFDALSLAGMAYRYRAAATAGADTQEDQEETKASLEFAEAFYRRALAVRPNSPDVLKYLTDIFADEHKAEEGIGCLLELSKKIESEHARLAVVLLLARLYDLSGQGDNAIAVVNEAVEERTDFLDGHAWLGILHKKAGRMPQAEHHFLKVIRLYDSGSFFAVARLTQSATQSTTMGYLHWSLMGLSDIFIDRKEFLKAADIIDQYQRVYYRTDQSGGLMYDDTGSAIPRSPVDIPATGMLRAGIAYRYARCPLQAIAYFRQAIRFAGDQFFFFLAEELLIRTELVSLPRDATPDDKQKPLDEARQRCCKMFDQVLKMKRPAENQANLARFFADIANKKFGMTDEDRIAALSDLQSRDPNNVYAALCRALICEATGDVEAARQSAQAAISMTAAAKVSQDTLKKLHEIAEKLLGRL